MSRTIKSKQNSRPAPLVSIVTATYNCKSNGRADFLVQCIKSVHAQTYKNIEHIIIDGASTDGTLALLSKYKKWLTIFSAPDRGIYDAMNRGWTRARGKYVLFLNSDDFYSCKTSIEKLVNALESGDYDFASGACNVTTEQGDLIYKFYPNPTRAFTGMPFPHPALGVKRAIMKQLNGFDINYKIAGDYDFILRMLIRGARGITIDDTITNFRTGGISETNRDAARQEIIKCFIKNYGVSKRLSSFIEKWGYIPNKVLHKISLNVKTPCNYAAMRKYNISRLLRFITRQIFTLHLGHKPFLRIFGITIINAD